MHLGLFMTTKKIRTKILIPILAAIGIGVGGVYALKMKNFLTEIAPLVTGYAAHTICTTTFIADRQPAQALTQDINKKQQRLTKTTVHEDFVTSTLDIGPIEFTNTALYRPGMGCSLLAFATEEQISIAKQASAALPTKANPALAWPENTPKIVGLDQVRLRAAVDLAFDETETDYEKRINTRALLVHYDGQLIAERYGDGFGKNTPLRGMSMTKSVTSAQVGILVQQGKIDIQQPANIRAWQNPGDPRSNVTVDDMLRMVSVFDYSEGYEDKPLSDVNRVLFVSPDMAAAASQFQLSGAPGEDWAYQTLNPVLLAKIIRDTIDNDEEYYRFAREQLFDKLGMYHSYLQADAAGTFAGGAFMYASARDWIRFGQLYLNDGKFNGEQILPLDWADYTNTASPASLKKRPYGAQFWLNAKGATQWMPSVPADAYAARGHNGQMTLIIPSKKLVIVRLGMTFDEDSWNPEPIVAEIIAALPSTK